MSFCYDAPHKNMTVLRTPFMELLREHLKRADWDYQRLLREARISGRTYARWLRGSNAPKPGSVRRIARALRLNEAEEAELLASSSRLDQAPSDRLARLEERISRLERQLDRLTRGFGQ